MCEGALIPSRTLSRPILRTCISISLPIISFSSFFRVTTSIKRPLYVLPVFSTTPLIIIESLKGEQAFFRKTVTVGGNRVGVPRAQQSPWYLSFTDYFREY